MNRATLLRWLRRLMLLFACFVVLVLFVVLPVGGSFLITNSRFQFRERGPKTPDAVGLPVEDVEFTSNDGNLAHQYWDCPPIANGRVR